MACVAGYWAKPMKTSKINQGPYLDVEEKKYKEVAPSTGRAVTVFGAVEFSRPRYRPSSGPGESIVPERNNARIDRRRSDTGRSPICHEAS